MFSQDSRYENVPIVTVVSPHGTTLAYLRRRFLPSLPEGEGPSYEPVQGDRIDQVSARALGDPLQFWRIADVNPDLNPYDLVNEVGRKIRLPGADA
jgi:hypothetical protein